MRFDVAFGGLIPGASGAVLAVLLRTGSGLTGRQVHGLVRDRFSLWSVQQDTQGLDRVVVLIDRVDHRATHRAAFHHTEPPE